MAKNNNLTDFMVSVANAIRTKKGTSGAINPQNFDSEILSIESMPTSTKALAKVVSGETPTDEITLNNALAVGLTDTPENATFAERTTADGGTIKDTIAFIHRVLGNCVKEGDTILTNSQNSVTSKDSTNVVLDNLPTNARNLTDSEGNTIFPNGLCSVGSVCDEWDMAKGTAIKRVGVVNMGTLSWAKNTYNNILSFRVATAYLPIAPTQGSAYLPNVLCCRYTTYKWNEAYSGLDMSLSQMSNAIVVQDSGYTDAVSFKTAMSGVYLYYELATPLTYAVAPCKAYYKVSQNGKEIANSTELSAPFKADIAYRGMSAEDLINELNG